VNPRRKAEWEQRCAKLVKTVGYFMDPNQYVPTPEQAGQARLILTEELFYDKM
tara:strand:- start:133 stop:291 length:159 start_codon:yes stop_codon:yes gene_type:complete